MAEKVELLLGGKQKQRIFVLGQMANRQLGREIMRGALGSLLGGRRR